MEVNNKKILKFLGIKLRVIIQATERKLKYEEKVEV